MGVITDEEAASIAKGHALGEHSAQRHPACVECTALTMTGKWAANAEAERLTSARIEAEVAATGMQITVEHAPGTIVWKIGSELFISRGVPKEPHALERWSEGVEHAVDTAVRDHHYRERRGGHFEPAPPEDKQQRITETVDFVQKLYANLKGRGIAPDHLGDALLAAMRFL